MQGSAERRTSDIMATAVAPAASAFPMLPSVMPPIATIGGGHSAGLSESREALGRLGVFLVAVAKTGPKEI